MMLKLPTKKPVYLADYIDRLPRWLLKSPLISATGRPLSTMMKSKKYLIGMDIGITEDNFAETVANHTKTIKRRDGVKSTRRQGKAVLQNLITYSLAREIKATYKNKDVYAIWIPSSSANPSEEHMLNYGQVFKLGEGVGGELPGERPNCQCGMRILSEADLAEIATY